MKVTPHGARLGKEVEKFNSRVMMDDIAVDGRWTDLTSAINYIRNGQASLAKINMTPYMQTEMKRYEKHFTETVRGRCEQIHKTGPPTIITNSSTLED